MSTPAAIAFSVGLGLAVTALFFVSTPVVLKPITKHVPELSLAAAMMFYVTKVVLFVLIVTVLLDPEGLGRELDHRWFTGAIIIGSLVHVVWLVVRHRRTRELIYDLDDSP